MILIIIILSIFINVTMIDYFNKDLKNYPNQIMLVTYADDKFNAEQTRISQSDTVIFHESLLANTILEIAKNNNAIKYNESEKLKDFLFYFKLVIKQEIFPCDDPPQTRSDTVEFCNFDYFYYNKNKISLDYKFFNDVIQYLPYNYYFYITRIEKYKNKLKAK